MNAKLLERIEEELTAVDMEDRYDAMLDEIYNLEPVGGPFANMYASRVLKEVDPIAYRCGMNDWESSENGETVYEVGSSYYDKREVEKVRDELADEIEREIDTLKEEIETLEAETEDDADSESVVEAGRKNKIEEITAQVGALQIEEKEIRQDDFSG